MKIVYRNYNILILLLVVEAEGRDDLAMTCIIIRYMERQADRRDEQFSSKASKILFLTLKR